MAENSKIEWTNHTWNPWRGCSHATLPDGTPHPGCIHCYAEAMSRRNPKVLGKWGTESEGGTRVLSAPQTFDAPLRWNEKAKKADQRMRVFVDSMSDLFDDYDGPVLNSKGQELFIPDRAGEDPPFDTNERGAFASVSLEDVRFEVFRLIDQCPWLDFLILTKRPQNVAVMWTKTQDATFWRPNVWIGTSISNQQTADALIPELLKCRDLCPVLFLSAEPLLEPIDMSSAFCRWYNAHHEGTTIATWPRLRDYIRWVIVGGESGPHARPMHPDWARSLRDQCQAAGVPFFFKQWGEWCYPEQMPESTFAAVDNSVNLAGTLEREYRVGKRAAGRLLDGREWNEFPVSRVSVS
jgi:protein gp37